MRQKVMTNRRRGADDVKVKQDLKREKDWIKVAEALAPVPVSDLSQSQLSSTRGCSPESGHTLITGGFVREIISISIAAFHSKLSVEIPKTNK